MPEFSSYRSPEREPSPEPKAEWPSPVTSRSEDEIRAALRTLYKDLGLKPDSLIGAAFTRGILRHPLLQRSMDSAQLVVIIAASMQHVLDNIRRNDENERELDALADVKAFAKIATAIIGTCPSQQRVVRMAEAIWPSLFKIGAYVYEKSHFSFVELFRVTAE